jgi:DNA-binding transcriptional regulator YdaS (Cro superfamily)
MRNKLNNSLHGIMQCFAKFETQRELARALNVSEVTVSHWLSGLKRPSYKNALLLEHLTGVPRQKIRPDIYPE